MRAAKIVGWSIGFAAAFAGVACSRSSLDLSGPDQGDSGVRDSTSSYPGKGGSSGGEGGSGGAGKGGSEFGGTAGQGGSAASAGTGASVGEGGSDSAGSGGEGGGVGGAGSVEPPSCQRLARVCGKDGNESCCSSLPVPGGSYPMGRSISGSDQCPKGMTCYAQERPEHAVTVSDYYLDEYEVTVGRFRKFINEYDQAGTKPKEGVGAHPKISGSGWQAQWDSELPSTAKELIGRLKCDSSYQTWRNMAGATEQHPINCVNWYEAFAFCAWDGGRLPTEAEWEFAAAGGAENRLYPWGSDTPDDTRAAFHCRHSDGVGGDACIFLDIAQVGMFPAGQGRWGHKDLAGNMWEWALDWFDIGWYGAGGKTCADCANLNADIVSGRTMRGGSFSSNDSSVRGAGRYGNALARRYYYMGFRCARNL